MKPYNIEIFDRQFNFLYTALIDEKDFIYKYDALSPEKMNISITKDFEPKSISNEPKAPQGWLIRIFRNSEEYQGIISSFEEKEIQNTIEISPLITLFNNEFIITSNSTIQSNIETVIKNSIVGEYVNNTDTQQNIYGLTANNITVNSTTKGAMDYYDVDNPNKELVINMLNDLVLKAASTYNIFVNCTFNAGTKNIYISIGKNTSNIKKIETELPNTLKKNVVIKKSQKEVNKVTIYDSYTSAKVNYYLHSDGSYSTVDTDRIYPVVNDMQALDGYEEAKSEIDAILSQYLSVINQYADYGGDLSQSEYDALRAARDALFPRVKDYIVLDALINQVADDVTTYSSETIVEPGTKSITFTPEESYVIANHNNLCSSLNIGSDSITIYYMKSVNGHHIFATGDAFVYVGKSDESYYTQTVTCEGFITSSMFSSAVADYKESGAYEAEIIEKESSILAAKGADLAKKIFSSNEYSNYIELTFTKNDSMINPLEMEIGQTVDIISEGTVYNSILTGKEIHGGLVKLIFGTIRLELTKILNMKGV